MDSNDAVAELVPSEQLHHIEGTAILHVTFAIKQDQDLGREFIRCFKVNDVVIHLRMALDSVNSDWSEDERKHW